MYIFETISSGPFRRVYARNETRIVAYLERSQEDVVPNPRNEPTGDSNRASLEGPHNACQDAIPRYHPHCLSEFTPVSNLRATSVTTDDWLRFNLNGLARLNDPVVNFCFLFLFLSLSLSLSLSFVLSMLSRFIFSSTQGDTHAANLRCV